MQTITHLHKPSTQLQTITLSSFLDRRQPCICSVKHSSLEFLALPTSPDVAEPTAPITSALERLALAEFNARILRVSAVKGSTQLAVLTDHYNPRLILLRCEKAPHARPFKYKIVSERSYLLEEMARPAAELGMGVWTAATASKEVVVAHTHSGNLKVLSFGESSSSTSVSADTADQLFAVK